MIRLPDRVSTKPAVGVRAARRPLLPAPDLLALAVVVFAALLLLSRQIVFGGTFYNDDIVLQSIPVYSWYAEGLRQGRIPIWSPSILGGFPLAFAQYGFFYPPDIFLFRLIDAARAFHLSLGLHLALAGACTYWYCRALGLRRLPSLFAALVFQMGNEVLSWPANGFITRTLFALPALLATVELTFSRSPRYWMLVPPIVGATLLGGYAQILLFALIVAGAYALGAAMANRRALGSAGIAGRLVLLSIGVALGFSLAAVRVLPTLGVTALSTRSGGMDFARAAVDSIEPWSLMLGLVLPAALELPSWAGTRPDYVGIPAIFLAALSMASLRRVGRVGWFHAGLAVIATALSLGQFTPLFGLLVQLPFVSYFRGPNRISLVAALAIAVLAAYALDRGLTQDLLRQQRRYRFLVVFSAIAAAAISAAAVASLSFQFGGDLLPRSLREVVTAGHWDLLNVLRPRVGIPLLGLLATPLLLLACARRRISHLALELSLLALSGTTLFLLGWIQNPWLPPGSLAESPALLRPLNNDAPLFRVFSWAPRISTFNVGAYYTGIVGSPPTVAFEDRYLRQFIPPNWGTLFGVQTADGYEVLQSRRQALLAAYMGSERTDPARFADGDGIEWKLHELSLHDHLNLLAALNVRYLMHAFELEDPRLELVERVSEQIYPQLSAEARVYLYRLKTSGPRAFSVPEGVVLPGEKDVLDALLEGKVDLRRVVIFEDQPPELEGLQLTPEGSSVEIVDYRDEQVVLHVRTDGAGYLVLMDFLLPGWSATVDGRQVPVLAGNFAGRVVPIRGAGDHQVVFSYEAPLLRVGLGLSLASLALVSVIALGYRLCLPHSSLKR